MNLKNQSVIVAGLVLLTLPTYAANSFPTSGNARIEDVVSDSGAASYQGVKARGTTSAMAVPVTNDSLVIFSGGGYNGTTLLNYNKAAMYFRAAETWSGSANGTYITLNTTAKGDTSLKERVRIEDGGNVGIGVTDPFEKLQVRGDILAEYIDDDGSSYSLSGLKARGTVGAETPPLLNDYLFSVKAGGYTAAGTRNDSRSLIGFRASENWTSTANGTLITFETTPNGSLSRQRVMTLDQSGNVGIGTTAPTHLLSVDGPIRAKEIIVDTGWSDYVFEPSYRLAPLSEVEQHIKEKGHLPDVPSAKEVAEKGVSVGESQALLLRKIEELTLHLIAQEKKMTAQQNETAQLRAELARLNQRSDIAH